MADLLTKGSIMKRTEYRGFVIDKDSLGRQYIYNMGSQVSEENDHKLLHGEFEIAQIKRFIDAQIENMQQFGSYNSTLSVNDF